jgi:hypothetical protein
MSVNYAVRHFSFTNADGTTPKAVSLPSGFDLKAVLFLSQQVESTSRTISLGAATGTSAQAGTYFRDAARTSGNTVASSIQSDASAVVSGNSAYYGTVTAWSSTGFSMTMDRTMDAATTMNVMALCIGGASVSADLRSLQLLASSGDTTVSGLGFDPVLIASGGINSATLNGLINDAKGAFGVSVGTTEHCVSPFAQNGVATSDSATNYRRDALLRMLSSSSSELHTVTVAHGTGGYTLTQSASGNRRIWVLSVGGIEAAVLSGAIPNATGTQSFTGAGFSPDASLVFGAPLVTSVGIIDTASVMLGVAANESPTVQGAVSMYSLDNDTPTFNVNASSSTSSVLQKLTDTTVDAEADVDSWDADGLTLDWTNADATAGLFTVVALGAPPASGPARSVFPFFLG